jgi:dipeptidyl aminopeptidase/acylaminoacyl peptidase
LFASPELENVMRSARLSMIALSVALVPCGSLAAQTSSVAPYISPAFPQELVAAKKANRIAWQAYDHGQRNVYTAAAPDYKPVRLTSFLEDDGIVLSDINISDDGSVVTFLRGGAPNLRGWYATPTSSPEGSEPVVWAASTSGGGAWRLGRGVSPVLSPDGRMVAFARDSQIFAFRVSRPPGDSIDRGLKPIIRAWGRNTTPRWSPDGTRLAFVSNRDNHAFVGVLDVKARKVTFMDPSVDFDTGPSWSQDSKRIAFVRRPGTPFGQQAQQGDGSLGLPPGPAFGRAGGRGGRGGGGGGANAQGRADGLYRAEFRGGYTISLMVADVATGKAEEAWHNQPSDRTFPNINGILFAGDNLIFQQEPQEWIRWYSVSAKGGTTTPVELTPGAGAVESVALSADGKTLFYATNAGDIDRRHVWKVATSGGQATQITNGTDIEMYPAALASGTQIALLSSGATRPMQVAVVSLADGSKKHIFPVLTKEYLALNQVVPENVTLKAEDGVEFHNQLFMPKGGASGRKPAIVFVHGGPIRQMLLGYHYMDFYHMSYAVNQWLANQGYVVLSVNYRTGVGYGKSFRNAANAGGRGNSEYRDVIAAGRYLASRPDVDPARVGIWGLSYGGVLTAQALARNSDVFAAGVDMAGVHLWGSSLDTADVSYKSSVISAIDGWKSPVLLWHNDDDRNVDFSQTIGLVDLLRARNVYYELIVNPDDTHETLLHKRWLETYDRMDKFLDKFLRNRSVSSR